MQNEIIPKIDAMEFLRKLDGNNLEYEFASKLQELTEAVKTTGNSGSITLKIQISPISDYGKNAVNIIPDITTRIPSRKCNKSVRYITDDSRIVEDDPSQLRITGKGF